VLRYFRINDPYRLITLLVLMLMAGLPLLVDLPDPTAQELKDLVLGERVGNKILYVQIIDRTPPLMAVVDGFMNFLFGRSILARHMVALMILFFQAAYFGILLINNKAYNENTYLPSLIFAFLCFFSFDLLALTPDLLASTLLLLALNNIFKEIEFRVDRDSVVLNIGIFLGLASLIIFSYIVFLAGAVFVLVVFARTNLRKILLLLLGFGLTHMVLFTLYYSYGNSNDLWTNFYLGNLDRMRVVSVEFRSMLVLGAVPLAYFVISLFMLTREARFTRYQSQIFQVLFLWMFLAAIQMMIAPEIAPHAFMTFLPPMAYLISHYLLLIRRKRIAEFMLWIFLIGILSVSTSSRQKWIMQVDYSALFSKPSPYADRISNKRVMIVGEDIDLFKQNSLGGFFLDWNLSREYFEHPEYYENIIRMNEAFDEDPPEVIIDELNLMEAVLERLPRIKSLYRKEGLVYWRI
jgi:hypothetical protein